MDLVIRHVAEGDVEAVHEILTSPHVVTGRCGCRWPPCARPGSG
jgi:hypothetical protein